MSELGVRMDYLDDVTVVEFGFGIAAPYAGKMFSDAGARVIKVEPEAGDELRHRRVGGVPVGSEGSALFQHLNAGKESVIGAPGEAHVEALLAQADLVIESFVPSRFDLVDLRRRYPSLVVLSITPFGRTGPWQDRPATDFTLQAESGSIGSRGRPDRPPFQAGGHLSEWGGGVAGAVGALAAVLRSMETGIGEHVDCSLLATDHMITNGNVCVRDSFLGHPAQPNPARIIDVPSIEPTADGFIGVNTNTRAQVQSYLELVGRPTLLKDEPRWASAQYRLLHAEEWNHLTRPWISRHTTAEVMSLAAERRIPVAPVNNGTTLLTQEQFVFRRSIGPFPGGRFSHPKPPYRINGDRPAILDPAPDLDQHGDLAPRRASRPAPPHASPPAPPHASPPAPRHDIPEGGKLPFSGLRVLDATAMWAGPVVGEVFAAMGAEVIHLESIQRLDLSRLKVDNAERVEQWWERGHTWSMLNWNKRDLTLDLSDAQGRGLVEALVKTCDVFVENYSPRVFEKFGLTGEQVMALNPDIVYVRMPAFGLDGPWREHIGFAQTMEQMSGLAWLTGPVDDASPQVPRGPCDPLAGYHALFATLVALRRRSRGLGGAVVEAAMAEAALNAAAESVLAVSAYDVLLERTGNRSADAAPQGLYRTIDPDEWLALSVPGELEWQGLRTALGHPGWTDNPALASGEGRQAEHDSIDEHLSAWAAQRSATSSAELLVAQGVPAAAVTDPRLADQHRQLNDFGYFEEVEHPIVGRHRIPTLPFRFASVDRWIRTPAPTLGEDNEAVLIGILGLDKEQVRDLTDSLIIGQRPLSSNPSFDL